MARSKAKGNRYEIKVARIISEWIFGDKNILWKDSTSGGRKIIYKGDVVPANAHEFPWSVWPFLFEAKNGYKTHVPTLMNQNKVREWLVKLLEEKDENQFIPILVAQFHCQIPIVVTPLLFDIHCDLCLMQEFEGQHHMFYVYKFKDLITTNFFHVVPKHVLQYIEENNKKYSLEMETNAQLPSNTKPSSKNRPKKSGKYDGIEDALGEILS